jgi:NAD-reducing hydrogenase large subunit
LFGFESEISKRNVIAVLQEHTDIGLQGVKLRKYGQEVIRMVSGKRVHGSCAIAGGVNKSLSREERDYLLTDIDQIIEWSEQAVALIEKVHCSNRTFHDEFATIKSSYMSLIGKTGALEIYHGGLRAKTEHGDTIFDQLDYREYNSYIHEEVRSWSYMKFPYLLSIGKENGWYRVGPLARVNNCDFISTPKAEAARQLFVQLSGGAMNHSTLAYHWTRLIEVLYCAEAIKELLYDPDIMGHDLLVEGVKRSVGIGVIEAPRGTLFHHYEMDENDLITKANLIVSTTNNNQAMNESVRQVAATYLDGLEITEPLLNNLEVAIRAYDPCLSCATHAIGKMPLEVELVNAQGQVVNQVFKNSQGT